MKLFFLLTYLANIGITLVSLVILPARMATHFGSGGMADGWASSQTNALTMTGINTLMFVMLYFSPQLISIFPPRLVNLPNKRYWLSPEHLDEAKATIGGYIWQFGAVSFIFMFVLGCLTIHANLSEPVRLHEPTIYAALIALLIYTVVWCIALFKAFRIPKDQPL